MAIGRCRRAFGADLLTSPSRAIVLIKTNQSKPMKNILGAGILGLALVSAARSGQAAEQPSLNEHLQPLQWQLGHWEGKGSIDDGSLFKVKLEVTSDVGGMVLISKWAVVDDQDNFILSGQGVLSWRAELKGLVSDDVNSMGGHAYGIQVKQENNKWTSQSVGFDNLGAFDTSTTELVKLDENSFSLQIKNQLLAGEPRPEIKVTYTRVKPSAEQEIIKLENQWNEALMHVDTDALDRLIAPEYAETGDKGQTSTKQEHISSVKSGEFKVSSAVLDDLKVRFYGNVAVVIGRNTTKEQYKGKDTSGAYRFTDTWAKRDDRWQCVASHWSVVEEKKP